MDSRAIFVLTSWLEGILQVFSVLSALVEAALVIRHTILNGEHRVAPRDQRRRVSVSLSAQSNDASSRNGEKATWKGYPCIHILHPTRSPWGLPQRIAHTLCIQGYTLVTHPRWELSGYWGCSMFPHRFILSRAGYSSYIVCFIVLGSCGLEQCHRARKGKARDS